MKTRISFFAFLGICVCTVSSVFSQAPRSFSYQGLLQTAGKNPVIVTGPHTITVKLYDASSGGAALHSESFTSQLDNGIFNVIVGSQVTLDPTISFDKQYWLGVSIDKGEELSPRTMLGRTPQVQSVAKSIIGTANQVLANGTFGIAQTDDVTLTLPQDIHSGASPTFAALTLIGKGTSAATVSTDFALTLTTKGYVDATDNLLSNNLNQEIYDRQGAITSEASERATADNGLATIIVTETTNRLAGDATNAVAISTEATRAQTAEGARWSITGNAGTNASTNFIGTTDNVDLVARTNNAEQLRLLASGGINIPSTASSGVGAIFQNAVPYLHSYGVNNYFAGLNAGNLTMTGATSAFNSPFSVPDAGPGDPFFVSTGDGNNTGIGYHAMISNTTGFNNTALGELALMSNTGGHECTAIGQRAMQWNTTGMRCVGVGNGALAYQTTGSFNTALGFSAGAHIITGSWNVAVGNAAICFDSLGGSRNSGLGFRALFNNTSASDNTATGQQVMFKNTTGSNNTAAGSIALFNNTTGAQNVAMGYNAGASNTTENANTFLGYASNGTAGITNATALGANAIVGASNTIQLGNGSVTSVTTTGSFTTTAGGIYIPTTTAAGAGVVFQNGTRLIHSFQKNNFFAGQNAGNFTMTGSDTAFSSANDGQTISIGDGGNTAIGVNALASNARGFINTAVGYLALSNNTTGFANTAVGENAMASNIIGVRNTAVGISALTFNTTGVNNTALGFQTLTHNTSGDSSVAVGSGTLNFSTTGRRNTGVGFKALNTSTTGVDNTSVGLRSMFATTTGGQNTAMGNLALLNNTTGAQNVAIGYNAGLSNTTTSANTFIGYASNGAAGITNATAIGANAVVSQSNAVILGSSADVGIRTSTPRAELDVNSTGAIIVPVGTTAQQPATPVQGMIRFNTTTNHFEGYNGTTWNNLD